MCIDIYFSYQERLSNASKVYALNWGISLCFRCVSIAFQLRFEPS